MVSEVTVQCGSCSLEKTFKEGTIIPAEWKADDGRLLCPNCKIPMEPIGARNVAAAEQAFADAARELADVYVVDSMAPSLEAQLEDRDKRLADIRRAIENVDSAQATYDSKHDAAKEAKKHLDNQLETLVTLTRRRATIGAAEDLPLLTDAAVKNAEPAAGQTLYTGLHEQLVAAGYLIDVALLSKWSPEERLEAKTWAAAPTIALPECLAGTRHEWTPEVYRARFLEELYQSLLDAGFLCVTRQSLDTWSEEELAAADAWDGTEDGLPAFMRALAEANLAQQ
jgi:hypothetical protein